MNYGRKAAFSLILAAMGLFLLGLMTSKAMWGMPEHYDAPWWNFIIDVGVIVGFGANGLLRFGEWHIERQGKS